MLIFLDQIVDLWTDYLWFSEVGFTAVFGGLIRTRIWLFLLFGAGVAAFVAANLYLAFRLRPMMRSNSPEQQALERYRMVLSPRIGLWIGLAAGLIGLFAGISGQGHWQQWLLFTNGGPFGIADPVYGADVGFYVFDYPFWRYLLDVGFTATALSAGRPGRALRLRRGPAAGRGRPDERRQPGPPDRAGGAVRAAEGRRVLPGPAGPAARFQLRHRPVRRRVHRHQRRAAGQGDPGLYLHRGRGGDPGLLQRGHAQPGLGRRLARPARPGAVAIGGIYPAVVQQFTVKPNVRDRRLPT